MSLMPKHSRIPKKIDSLVVNSLVVCCHGSLLEGLSKGGVGVTCPGNVLRASTVLQSKSALCNHLSSVRSNNVNAQYPVGFSVRQEFDHAVRVGVGLCSRVGREGEVSNLVLDAGSLKLLLVLSDPGDFWVGVHDRGNCAIVDVTIALGNVLDSGDSLLLSLVGQHGSEGYVADGTDVRDLGAVLLVDDQAAPVVGLETDIVEAETGSVGTATDGDEDNVGIELQLVSL
jgi:hypothetical protein